MRMSFDNDRARKLTASLTGGVWFDAVGGQPPWRKSVCLATFLLTYRPTIDIFLNVILPPYRDPVLLEARREQVLELFVSKAPEGLWTRWLQVSLLVAARADDVDVFLRLYALCRIDSGLFARGAVDELLGAIAANGSAKVMSFLSTVDLFRAVLRGVDGVRRPHSALQLAAIGGHRGCVAALVKAGVPLEDEHQGRAGTALTRAVEGGHRGVVLELLAAGADVDGGIDQDVNAPPLRYLAWTNRLFASRHRRHPGRRRTREGREHGLAGDFAGGAGQR